MYFIKIGKTVLITALLLTFFSTKASVITESVIIGDKEWAQAAQFEGLDYAYIKEFVCPDVACTGTARFGDGKELDLTGWTWASIFEVRDLFNEMAPLGANDDLVVTGASPWGAGIFDIFGFTPNFEDGDYRILSGVSSTVMTPGATLFETEAFHGNIRVAYQEFIDDGMGNQITFIDSIITSGSDAELNSGAWFYRSVPSSVPAPSLVYLIFAACIGLLFRERKKLS